jgi:hypothetical protein
MGKLCVALALAVVAGGSGTAGAAPAAKVYHYLPSVKNVTWLPGCGRPPPDGRRCHFGPLVTYTPLYVDLKTTIGVAVRSPSLITVAIDTWSTRPDHPKTKPRPVSATFSASGVKEGATYQVRVLGHDGKLLWSGVLATSPPAP